MNNLLTVKEVARELGKSPQYVYERTTSREIPHIRFGKSIRIRPESIPEYEIELARKEKDPNWITLTEAADRYGFNRRTLMNMAYDGCISIFKKKGKGVLVDIGSVEKYINEQISGV